MDYKGLIIIIISFIISEKYLQFKKKTEPLARKIFGSPHLSKDII